MSIVLVRLCVILSIKKNEKLVYYFVLRYRWFCQYLYCTKNNELVYYLYYGNGSTYVNNFSSLNNKIQLRSQQQKQHLLSPRLYDVFYPHISFSNNFISFRPSWYVAMGSMDDDPKVSWLESTLATEKEPIECDDKGKFQLSCVPIQ